MKNNFKTMVIGLAPTVIFIILLFGLVILIFSLGKPLFEEDSKEETIKLFCYTMVIIAFFSGLYIKARINGIKESQKKKEKETNEKKGLED